MIDYHCNECNSRVKQRADFWYVEIAEKDCDACEQTQKEALDAFVESQGYSVQDES